MRRLVGAFIGVAFALCAFARCDNDRCEGACSDNERCSDLGKDCICFSGQFSCVQHSPQEAGVQKDGAVVVSTTCPSASMVKADTSCATTAPTCASLFACGAPNEATGQCACTAGAWSCTPDSPCFESDASIDASGEAGDAGEVGDAADAGDAD